MSSAKFRDRFVEIRPKGKTGGTVLSNGKEATTADDPTKDGEEQEENCDNRPTSASRKQRLSPSQEMSQSPPTLAKAKKPNADEKETDAVFIQGIAEKYQLTGNSFSVRRQN